MGEIRERAKELFPTKTAYNLKEVAAILGISPQTLYNNKSKYPFGYLTTIEQLEKTAERWQSRPRTHHRTTSKAKRLSR